MTDQHYNLRLAIRYYFKENNNVIVPPHYFDHIVDAYDRSRVLWDTDHAAALILFSAFYDGELQSDDLSLAGQKAMQWANLHIGELNISKGHRK